VTVLSVTAIYQQLWLENVCSRECGRSLAQCERSLLASNLATESMCTVYPARHGSAKINRRYGQIWRMRGSARTGFLCEPTRRLFKVCPRLGFSPKIRRGSHVEGGDIAEGLFARNGIKKAKNGPLLGGRKRHVDLHPSEQDHNRMTLRGQTQCTRCGLTADVSQLAIRAPQPRLPCR
jgi:hypothetical protein